MGHDLAACQLGRVDRDLVDATAEIVGRRPVRPAVQVVAAHAPVAVVGLCRCRRRITPDEHAIDVQPHASGALGGDRVVPLTVVVGLRRRDGAHPSRIDPEGQPTVVLHVHVPVVAGRRPRLRAAEPEDLAAAVGRRHEPCLRGELGRDCSARGRRHTTVAVAAEAGHDDIELVLLGCGFATGFALSLIFTCLLSSNGSRSHRACV